MTKQSLMIGNRVVITGGVVIVGFAEYLLGRSSNAYAEGNLDIDSASTIYGMIAALHLLVVGVTLTLFGTIWEVMRRLRS